MKFKRDKNNRTRTREILSVLRKHKIYKGLSPEKFRCIMEDLGPTFIKLGQLLSMREDMLPAEYCRELALLRTRASAIQMNEIRQVIEEEYKKPLEEVFAFFNEEPLGTASIAQAHIASLKNGKTVVVKVQRPGIWEVMERDIALLRKAAGILNRSGVAGNVMDFKGVLDEIWRVAQQEMDFVTEAGHIEEFALLNKDIVYAAVPEVEKHLVTPLVLVMEYVDGISIDNTKELLENGYELKEVGEKLAENYIKQILDDAFFHADPHPGNICVRGGKIVWLDLGMMGRLCSREQELLRRVMYAVAQKDTSEVMEVLLELGTPAGPVNHIRLREELDSLLNRYTNMQMRDVNLSRLMEDAFVLVKKHGITMPDNITMLGRGMMIIQSNLAVLSPDINLASMFANHIAGDMTRDDVKKALRKGLTSIFNSGRKLLDVPAQASDLLRMTLKGHTKINVEQSYAPEAMRKADSITNRLVLGIIIASLVLGSSILTAADSTFMGAAGYFTAALLSVRLFWITRKGKY